MKLNALALLALSPTLVFAKLGQPGFSGETETQAIVAPLGSMMNQIQFSIKNRKKISSAHLWLMNM